MAWFFEINDYMIPHNKPTLGIEEEQAALRVLRSGWVTQGPEVKKFENEFCEFIGLPKGHALAVANGTAALYLALISLEPTKKRISIPSYTCSILRNVAIINGAQEILVDVGSNSPNIDLDLLKQNNSEIAIIPHMYGIPTDLSEFKSTSIIEDCAQAIGAKVNGKLVGLQGTIGIFSFHATKLLTSGGQGGMIISENKKLINNIRDLREYGTQDNKIRLNFQMTDLQAAIGREQLKKLPSFLSRRSKIFQHYNESGIELLDVAPEKKDVLSPVRFRAIMKTNKPKQIIKALDNKGIRATVLIEYSGLLGNPALFPNARKLSECTVSLPIFPTLTDNEVDFIIDTIKNCT